MPWGTGEDVTGEDVERFKQGVRRSPYRIARLKLSGGEPTLHRGLQEICRSLVELRQERLLESVVVVTNGSTRGPDLPLGCRYRRTGTEKAHHEPHLVSPHDMFVRGELQVCGIQKTCGVCFDKPGWTFCGLAWQFGQILSIDVHSEDITVERDGRICQHCIWSLPSPVRDAVHWCVYTGIVSYPTPTFAAALGVPSQEISVPELWGRHHQILTRAGRRGVSQREH